MNEIAILVALLAWVVGMPIMLCRDVLKQQRELPSSPKALAVASQVQHENDRTWRLLSWNAGEYDVEDEPQGRLACMMSRDLYERSVELARWNRVKPLRPSPPHPNYR